MFQAKRIGTDSLICSESCLSELMYSVSHLPIKEEKPVILFQQGNPVGIASFGQLTTDGRETYFLFPNGSKKFVKLFADLDNLN